MAHQVGQTVEEEKALKIYDLLTKRTSLNVALYKTITNLDHFKRKCQENPSSEDCAGLIIVTLVLSTLQFSQVEGLFRFHQDRVMQIQVELKSVRQCFKEMQRASLRPLRHHIRRKQKGTIAITDILDTAMYTIIFPLVAAVDGQKARMLPQVCKVWRDTFEMTKKDWTAFAVTRPISDCSGLCNVLQGTCNLKHLQVLFDESLPVLHPERLGNILSPQTSLQSLAFASPGLALQLALPALPANLREIRIECTPDLDMANAATIANRLPFLTKVDITDAPCFDDEALNALVASREAATNPIECISVSGCRTVRGAGMRTLARNCKNLKSVRMARCPISALALEPLGELTSLEEIGLVSCTRSDAGPAIDLVRNTSSKLRSVILFEAGALYNDSLNDIVFAQPGLTKLVLGPCGGITDNTLATALATLPHLRHLAMTGCHLLSDGALCSIATNLPGLEQLLLTETAGFSDAGVFAMEDCTALSQLTLHPVQYVSSAGLRVLCDYCDSLEYLCLAHCPAATQPTIVGMLECCIKLKVLIITHVQPISEEGIAAILASSCILKCLALVPKREKESIATTSAPVDTRDAGERRRILTEEAAAAAAAAATEVAASQGAGIETHCVDTTGGSTCASTAGDHTSATAESETATTAVSTSVSSDGGTLKDDDERGIQQQCASKERDNQERTPAQQPLGAEGIERLMRQYPDVVFVSDWVVLDKVLDVCLPALEGHPEIRHAVLGDLFVGGRSSGSMLTSIEDPTAIARRVVGVLLRALGLDRRERVHRDRYLRDIALLREAIVIEMGNDEMQDHIRILFEMDTVLETYELDAPLDNFAGGQNHANNANVNGMPNTLQAHGAAQNVINTDQPDHADGNDAVDTMTEMVEGNNIMDDNTAVGPITGNAYAAPAMHLYMAANPAAAEEDDFFPMQLEIAETMDTTDDPGANLHEEIATEVYQHLLGTMDENVLDTMHQDMDVGFVEIAGVNGNMQAVHGHLQNQHQEVVPVQAADGHVPYPAEADQGKDVALLGEAAGTSQGTGAAGAAAADAVAEGAAPPVFAAGGAGGLGAGGAAAGGWGHQIYAGMRMRELAARQHEMGLRAAAGETKASGPDRCMLRLLRLFPHLATTRMLLHAKCHCAGKCALANSIRSTFRRLDRARPWGMEDPIVHLPHHHLAQDHHPAQHQNHPHAPHPQPQHQIPAVFMALGVGAGAMFFGTAGGEAGAAGAEIAGAWLAGD